MRGIGVVADPGINTFHFVGCDIGANARSAQQNTAFGITVLNGSSKLFGKIGVIDTFGALSPFISAGIDTASPIGISEIIVISVWRIFVFTSFSVIGLLITEINLPEPDVR